MRRSEVDELVRTLLARLGEEVAPPSESELRSVARHASREGRRPEERPSAAARVWRPLRLRWASVGAAALLLATGLGFGVASWLTPASSARSSVSGLGFLPAEGWTSGDAEGPGTLIREVPDPHVSVSQGA